MVISLIGCNSQPKINSKEKELLTTIEIAASKDIKKSFEAMQADGYGLKYNTECDTITFEKEEYQFVVRLIEGDEWEKLKFIDSNGAFIYCSEIKDDSNPTLINLVAILKKYDTNMADVEYELKELLSEHRLELKKKELDEKYPARKKLADAGYELTGFATDENGQNTISSTWTRTKQEDGIIVNISLDIIDKSYIQEYEKSTKIIYSYYWGENTATVKAATTFLKYDFNENTISESNGLDEKSEVLYSSQAAYIKQEFEKEMKRIGINVKDLVMPE